MNTILVSVWLFLVIDRFYPHASGFFHFHFDHHAIGPVSVKQQWDIWVNISQMYQIYQGQTK